MLLQAFELFWRAVGRWQARSATIQSPRLSPARLKGRATLLVSSRGPRKFPLAITDSLYASANSKSIALYFAPHLKRTLPPKITSAGDYFLRSTRCVPSKAGARVLFPI